MGDLLRDEIEARGDELRSLRDRIPRSPALARAPPQVAQHLARGVAPAGSHYAAAGVRAGTAQVEPAHRGTIDADPVTRSVRPHRGDLPRDRLQ